MIIHRYSQWEPPEEPPFTLDDVIRAATDIMMRFHVDFNEALRYLIEQGMPINQFLRDEEMDSILDDYIKKVEDMKEEMRRKSDLNEYMKARGRRVDDLSNSIREHLKGRDDLLGELDIAARNRSVPGLHHIRWQARMDDELSRIPDLFEGLDRAIDQAEAFEDALSFHRLYGKDFKGSTTPTRSEALSIFKKYEALDKLGKELLDAKEKGDLFGIGEETLREALGDEAYEKFAAARDEIMEKLSQALSATGEVSEEDGIFKLTPAAARKIGERTLRQVFENLKIEGAGRHRPKEKGEGPIESVSTRPYEFGDSITHMDVPGSMINALIRGGAELPIRIRAEDMEIHDTYGLARSSLVVLIDRSGSMSRFGRFYNAKKMALALDSLIREEYQEDSVHFVGFATFANRIHVGDILSLGPEPITFMGGGVNLRVDMSRVEDPDRELRHVPKYFTNLQAGLKLARRILAAQRGVNKEIILITDGSPTAFYKGSNLILTYPPQEETFTATLREVRALTEEGIVINTFALGSDFDSGFFGEDVFIKRMLGINRGRLFYPEPDSLTKYVLVDYVANKRRLVEI